MLVNAPVESLVVDATGVAAGVVVGLRGGAAVVPCRTVVSSVGVRTTFERLLPAEHRHRVARPLKALQDPALAPPSCCHLMLFVALGQHSRLTFSLGRVFTLMHDAPLCSRRRRRRAWAAGLQLLDCRKHHHFTVLSNSSRTLLCGGSGGAGAFGSGAAVLRSTLRAGGRHVPGGVPLLPEHQGQRVVGAIPRQVYSPHHLGGAAGVV